MKKIVGIAICTLTLILYLAAGSVEAQTSADQITGIWWSDDKEAKIEIFRKGSKYFGKIVYLTEPNNANGQPLTDTENEDANLRSRPIIGMTILSDLEYEEDNEYENGEIYDPKSGKTYSLNAEVNGKQLNLRGYVGISLIGRTTTWTRAE